MQDPMVDDSTDRTRLLPFLKWAGGKRWLAERITGLTTKRFRRYIEPFLGSGAVFFALRPRRALLCDSNSELIEAYSAIRGNWQRIQGLLELHQLNHSSAHYYDVRDKIPEDRYERAARFLYLNRACWNGLYRVNLAGVFNVPIGTKQNILLETDNFEAIASRLKSCQLAACDFETAVDSAQDGDLVFADPPYTIQHNLNGFIKYNECLFAWEDQVRLRDSLLRASKRGANVIVTNADHDSIRKLYAINFSIRVVNRFSRISGTPRSRGSFTELIISSQRT